MASFEERAKLKGSKEAGEIVRNQVYFKESILPELLQLSVGTFFLLLRYFFALNESLCLFGFFISIFATWQADFIVGRPWFLVLIFGATYFSGLSFRTGLLLFACCLMSMYIIAFEVALIRRKTLVNCPGEHYSFFFGILEQMIPRLRNNTFYTWRLGHLKEFKGQAFKDTPPCFARDIVVNIVKANDIEHILKTNVNNYVKSQFLRRNFEPMLGLGIFAENHAFTHDGGENWHIQRKLASKIFTGNNFRVFFMQCFVEHGAMFQEILEDFCSKNKVSSSDTEETKSLQNNNNNTSTNSKTEIDVQDLFFRYTLDCIGQLGFGVDLGCLAGKPIPFAKAFDRCQAITFMKFYVPIWFWPISTLLFPEKRELPGCEKVLDDFAFDVIKQRKNDGDLENKNDLLSLVLREPEEKFSPKFMRDLILNIALAGRDTTACTLTWIFYLLSKNNDIQTKLLEEIDEELKGNPPTYEQLNNNHEMPYLHGVMSEALRLYPSVPVNPKVTVEPDVLPSGVVLPPGTIVQYHPFLAGRDPDLWPEPEKMIPERWIESKHPGFFAFPVFQAGPRICLGMNMAQLETKVLTCMILQKFTLSLAPGFEPNMSVGITLSSTNGLMMQVKKRVL